MQKLGCGDILWVVNIAVYTNSMESVVFTLTIHSKIILERILFREKVTLKISNKEFDLKNQEQNWERSPTQIWSETETFVKCMLECAFKLEYTTSVSLCGMIYLLLMRFLGGIRLPSSQMISWDEPIWQYLLGISTSNSLCQSCTKSSKIVNCHQLPITIVHNRRHHIMLGNKPQAL